ncbi:hypothetical protein CLONEX_01226 [[Clostridium] nexile DSM 1787]|nr:hypothetical protein CLONEX_01226 [[Clostridium] nexile DSM 1787]
MTIKYFKKSQKTFLCRYRHGDEKTVVDERIHVNFSFLEKRRKI